MYQLFISTETEITSEIPGCDMRSRCVTVTFQLQNTSNLCDCVCTCDLCECASSSCRKIGLIIGVTVSATGVHVIAIIILVVSTTVVCYRRRVKIIRVEQQREAAIETQTNISYRPVTSANTIYTQLHPNPSYRPVDVHHGVLVRAMK